MEFNSYRDYSHCSVSLRYAYESTWPFTGFVLRMEVRNRASYRALAVVAHMCSKTMTQQRN